MSVCRLKKSHPRSIQVNGLERGLFCKSPVNRIHKATALLMARFIGSLHKRGCITQEPDEFNPS
jgi:hypothetical protein